MATTIMGHVMAFLNDFGLQQQEHCLGACLHRHILDQAKVRELAPDAASRVLPAAPFTHDSNETELEMRT